MFNQSIILIQAEGQLSNMKSEKERLKYEADEEMSSIQTRMTELETEKLELQAFLDEEKRWLDITWLFHILFDE